MLRAMPVLFFSLLAAAGASQAATVAPSEQPALHALANAPSEAELERRFAASRSTRSLPSRSQRRSVSRLIPSARDACAAVRVFLGIAYSIPQDGGAPGSCVVTLMPGI